MPASPFITRKDTVPYTANGKVVTRIPRDGVIRIMFLRLYGQLTCTAANNLRANTLLGDECNVIQRVEIIADNNTLRSIPGYALKPITRYYYGLMPKLAVNLGDCISNGAGTGTANPWFDTLIPIPFWMPRTVKPLEFALPAYRFNDLRVEVQWGTHTSINSAATGFTTAPNIDILTYYTTPIDGNFNLTRVYPITQAVSAANERQRINIPVGPRYRGFLVQCLSSDGTTEKETNVTTATNETNVATTAGANDQGISNYRLTSGDVNFIDMPGPVVTQDMRMHLQMPFPEAYGFNKAAAAVPTGLGTNIVTSNQAFTNVPTAISSKACDSAWAMFDFVRDGYTTEMLDTYGWTELFFELNVRAASLINIFPLEVTPVR